MSGKGLVITLGIIAVAVILLLLSSGSLLSADRNTGFEGTDSKAAEVIQQTGYQPWTKPVFGTPDKDRETLFFALQAAAGAIVIGWFFGCYRRSPRKKG